MLYDAKYKHKGKLKHIVKEMEKRKWIEGGYTSWHAKVKRVHVVVKATPGVADVEASPCEKKCFSERPV